MHLADVESQATPRRSTHRRAELDIAAIAVAQEKHRSIAYTIETAAAIVASATLKVAILRGRHHGSVTLAAPGTMAEATLKLAGTGCLIHNLVHSLALPLAPVTMNGVKEQPNTTSTGPNGKPNTVTAREKKLEQFQQHHHQQQHAR